MDRAPEANSRPLSPPEQRALASFLAGRLPAGQLEAELARARTVVPSPSLAAAVVAEPAAVLHAA